MGAGVAGAGGGTFILIAIEALPDSSPVKYPLTIAVPTLSVVFSGWALFCMKAVKKRLIERKLTTAGKNFCSLANQRLADANTSEPHKQEIRRKLEEFQRGEIENQLGMVKALQEDRTRIEGL